MSPPRVNGLPLMWYDVTIKMRAKDGHVFNYFVQYLAADFDAAYIRAKKFHDDGHEEAELLEIAITPSRVQPDDKPTRTEPIKALPAPAKPVKPALTDDEKRLIAAFSLLPLDYKATLYVQGSGGGL